MAGNANSKNLDQHAFTTGEVAPAFFSRQDEAAYESGLQKCENFQIAPQGGIYNDTGTVFIAAANLPAYRCRLIPFVFNNAQAYQIEMGLNYARFFTNNGRIESPPGTPIQITTPYLDTDLATIQFCQSGDFLYLVHPKYPPAAITRMSNISWAYQVLNFKDGPYQDENLDNTKTLTASATIGTITITANFNAFFPGNVGAPIRLEEAITSYYNPWTPGVCYQTGEYVASAGSVYQCTNGVGTSTSSSRAIGQWLNGVAYPVGYYVYWGINCYISANAATSGTTPPVHTSGTVSDGGVMWTYIGARSGARAPVHRVGTQSDGNLSFSFQHSGFGYATITGYTSPTQVTATVLSRLPSSATGGTLRWRLGAWDTYNGYPACCCFYEQRFTLAGTVSFPEDLWFSSTGDYYNFAPTDTGTNVLDTNSIHVTIASNTINQIVWITPQTRLLVGTIGSEWQIWTASTSSGFSPSNLQAKPMTYNGSAPLPARPVGLSNLYVHRSQQRVYEMSYQYLYDLYVSKDLNLVAEHILREGNGIVDTAFQLTPYSTIWYLRADGVLVGLTYLPDEKENGWHTHVYHGAVESISCIPGPNNIDQLWIVVNRTINGQTVRYIEVRQDPFYPQNPQDKAAMWYVECGLSLTTATPVHTVSGLNYLQGQTIVPVVDGAVQPVQVVPPSGTITLQTPAQYQVVVGLPYVSTMTVLPLDFEGVQGSVVGQVKRVQKVRMQVLNSLGFSLFAGTVDNPNGPTGVVQAFRQSADNMSQSPSMVTGNFSALVAMAQSTDGVYTIQQTQPYPLNILGVISEVTTYEQ